MKIIKTWLRNWAALDLTVIGLAAALIGGYINYKQTYTDEGGPVIKPLVDLWPNVGSEVLGIYFSVRIIDALIQARERHHAIRRRFVYSFSAIIRITRDLLPECYDWRVRELKTELSGLNSAGQKWKKKFSADEIADIEAAEEAGDALHMAASELTTAAHAVEDTFRLVDRALDAHNERNPKDHLYRHSWKWFGRVDEECRKLRQRGTFDRNVLDDAFTGLTALASRPELSSAVTNYLNAAKELLATYEKVVEANTKCAALAHKANLNILEESELL